MNLTGARSDWLILVLVLSRFFYDWSGKSSGNPEVRGGKGGGNKVVTQATEVHRALSDFLSLASDPKTDPGEEPVHYVGEIRDPQIP